MQGRKILTGCMLFLFILSILSVWIPIPRLLIRGISFLVFAMSAVRNCIYYKRVKGKHSFILWSMIFVCLVVAALSLMTSRFLWRILYVSLLYCFFILAEMLIYGKFRKSYLLMGACVIGMMLANFWTDAVWVYQVIWGLQMVLMLRLLNPFLEGLAEKGRKRRTAQENLQPISFWRRVLFGKSGKFRIPGITG